jgi:hypothetical protein
MMTRVEKGSTTNITIRRDIPTRESVVRASVGPIRPLLRRVAFCVLTIKLGLEFVR